METLFELTKLLMEGGPWAMMAILLVGVVTLARAYDKSMRELNAQLTSVLVEATKQSERQSATNDKIAEVLERFERRLESVERANQ